MDQNEEEEQGKKPGEELGGSFWKTWPHVQKFTTEAVEVLYNGSPETSYNPHTSSFHFRKEKK